VTPLSSGVPVGSSRDRGIPRAGEGNEKIIEDEKKEI